MADVALDDYIKTKHITRSGRGAKTGGAAGGGRGAGARARGGAGGKAPQRQANAQRTGNRLSGAIIKNTQRRSGGGGGGGGGGQNFARNSGGGGAGQGRWTHDLYGFGGDAAAAGGLRSRSSTMGAKLIISNLDYGVSESDIRDLFSELGDLIRSNVHFDVSGRSLGTAEIVYARPGDAVAALKKYNGVPLDGKAMEIQLVGGPSIKVVGNGGGALPQQRRTFNNQGGRVGTRQNTNTGGRPRGGGRVAGTVAGGGRGGRRGGARGGGQARAAKPEVTQEQLDMELDEYQSTANKTA